MSGLMLCGKKAERPLYVKEIDKNIYTMEELSYYIYNNIYMINHEFFDKDLIDFIENQLKMEKLAGNIKYHINKRSQYTQLIKVVLDGSFYYSDNEKKILDKELHILSKKTPSERIKSKADILMSNRRFENALKTYRNLLERKDKEMDSDFISGLWNNIGIIYARMFLYLDAKVCFELALDLEFKQEYIDNLVFLGIMIDESEETDIELKKIKEKFNINDENIEEYYNTMEEEKKKIMGEEPVASLARRLENECINDLNSYYKSMDEFLKKWKEDYRQEIQ